MHIYNETILRIMAWIQERTGNLVFGLSIFYMYISFTYIEFIQQFNIQLGFEKSLTYVNLSPDLVFDSLVTTFHLIIIL